MNRHIVTRALAATGVFAVLVSLMAGALTALPATAAAGILKQISFQGKVVNSDGTNVADASYTFVFKLYTASSGGSATWTETKSLSTVDGVFQTNLGDTTSLPGSVDFNTDNIYLGINFNSDGEMTPRIRFTASPYAFNSDALQGLHASDFAQLNPSSAQTGSLNVSGTVQAGTSVLSPAVDALSGGALAVGGSNATSVTVGKTTTNFTLQGASGASGSAITATNGANTTTVKFTNPTGNNSILFPDAGGTICTTTAATCSSTYQVASATGYLAKNTTDTSSFAVTAAGNLYTFTNSSSAVASGVLKLDNGNNTGTALFVTATAGTLLDLQNGGASKFAVSSSGVATLVGGQTQDINTADAATAAALTIQPGATSANNGTGATETLKGGNTTSTTCGTACTGGALTLQGGDANGGATTTNGGNVNIDAGTGTTANGTVNIATVNSGTVNIGKTTGSGGINIGRSNGTTTLTIDNTVPSSTNTQTINIASGSSNQTSASTIAVNILSNSGNGTNGTATLALGNSDRVTSIDIANATADASRIITVGAGNTLTGNTDTINIGTGDPAGTGTKVVHIADGNPAGGNTVTVGSTAGTSTTNVQAGSGGITLNGNTSVSSGKNVTIAGGSITQTFNSGVAAGSADSMTVANNNSGAGVTVQGLNIAATNNTSPSSGTNVLNAISFAAPTTGGGGLNYGLNFANTGYTDVLRVNGSQIISGAGVLQNSGISSAVTYSNLQNIGTTSSSLSLFGSSASTWTIGSAGNVTTLKFAAPSGVTNVTFPALAGNQNVCYQNDTNCGFLTGSSSAFVQNLAVTATAQATASFHIDTSGRADVSLIAPLFETLPGTSGTTADVSFQSGDITGTTGNSGNVVVDAGTHGSSSGTAGILSVGQTNASSINFGHSSASLDLRGKASGSGLTFYDAGGTNFTKLQFTAPTTTTTLNVPNAGTTVCTDSGTSCNGGGAIGTGYIQNQTASVQTAGFNISGNASIGGNVVVTGTYNTNTFTASALTFGGSASGVDTITTASTTGLNLAASGTSIWSTSAGNLTVQDTAASSTLALDAGASGGGNAGTITIGNTNTGTVSIATNAAAHTIGIGTGAAVEGVSIGSANTTSATTIEGGASGSSGTPSIAIGNGATAHNIQIGSNSGAAQVLTLGSTNASSTITMQSGATTATLQSTGGTLKTSTDSATAFQVQNSNSDNLLLADTTNTNLFGNPSFESATAGAWAARGGPTLTFASTDQTLFGVASLKLVTSATSNDGVKYVPSPQLTNTQPYGLSFWAMTSGSNFTVRFGNSNAGSTGGETNCGTGTVTNTWQRFSCTFTAGVQSAGAYVYITQNDSTSRTFYIDGAQLELTAPTAYHEGQLQLNGLVTAPITVKNTNDSSAAFDVQNAAGTSQLTVDVASGKTTAEGVTFQTVSAVPTVGSTASALTVGGASTAVTVQGNGSTVLKATNGGNTVTVGFASISGTGTYNFASPAGAGPYTICTTDTTSCATSYTGIFLRSNSTDTASADAGTGKLYTFTNSNGTNAAGSVLDLENGGATGSAFIVQGGNSLGAGKALIFANNTLNNATGNLIDLQSTQGGTQASRFSVSTVGNTTVAGTLASGTLTVTSASQNTMSGGLSLSGGLANNSGGITATGSIAGATTIAANNTLTLSGTGAAELVVNGAPAASGSSSLVQFGNALSGASGNGTYLGINLPNASSADFLNFQLNNAARFKVDNNGALTLASNITDTGNLVVDATGTLGLGNGSGTTGVTLGRTTTTTAAQGTLQVGTLNTAGTGALINNGSTQNSELRLSNFSSNGNITTANVDAYTYISIPQTNTSITVSIQAPTNPTTEYGKIIYVSNIGTVSLTLGSTILNAGSTATMVWSHTNGADSWTFAGADASGILNQTGTNQAANFQIQSNIAGGVSTSAATAIIKAGGTQTGDLLQFQPSGSTTPIAKVDVSGNLTAQGGTFTGNLSQSAGTVALTANGASSFTTSAGALTITSAAAATWSTAAGNLAVTAAAALNLTGAANSTWTVGSSNTLAITSSNFAVSSVGVVTLAGNQTTDITVASVGATSTGNSLTLKAGSGGATSGDGGALNLTAGSAVGSSNNAGGALTITSGSATGTGTSGLLTVQSAAGAASSGATNAGVGGALTIQGGAGGANSGTGNGGNASDVQVIAGAGGNATSGHANGNGGNVRLTAGNAGGGAGSAGVPGVVYIDSPVLTSVSQTFTQTANNQSFPAAGAETTTLQANVDGFGTLIITMAGAFTGGIVNIPSPGNTAAGHLLYIVAGTGSASFTLTSTSMPSFTVSAGDTATLVWTGTNWTAGVAANSLQQVYNATTSSPASIVTTSSTKNILVQAGVGFDNANLFQVGNSLGAQTLTVDTTNTANSTNLAQNSGGETGGTPPTSWSAHNGTASPTITQDTTSGEYAAGAAGIKVAIGSAGTGGVRNALGAALATSTVYNVSFSIKVSSSLTNSNLVVEYYRNNTPTLDATCSSMTAPAISTSQFIKYACSLTTTSTAGNTTAFLAIRQADSVNRNLFIDSLAIIAQTTGTQNVADVQVGGINGQGLTLLTLDTYASKPFTGTGNTALLGSMYYDTTAGRIQCYESDGWGSCGAAPNNNVTFIAEYGNAVIAPPPGVTNNNGTMTASLCSGTSRFSLNTTVCAATEEFNYYQWTSTQATAQQYSIYAKYQLPPTFNGFVDDNTIQMTARTTNTTNGSVKLSVWGNTGTQCGSTTTITSSANTWQTVSLTGNETGCGFVAGDVITFRVDMSANSSAQVFASNISFTMTGK